VKRAQDASDNARDRVAIAAEVCGLDYSLTEVAFDGNDYSEDGGCNFNCVDRNYEKLIIK